MTDEQARKEFKDVPFYPVDPTRRLNYKFCAVCKADTQDEAKMRCQGIENLCKDGVSITPEPIPDNVRHISSGKNLGADPILGCPICNQGHMFVHLSGKVQCVICLTFLYPCLPGEKPGDDVSHRV